MSERINRHAHTDADGLIWGIPASPDHKVLAIAAVDKTHLGKHYVPLVMELRGERSAVANYWVIYTIHAYRADCDGRAESRVKREPLLVTDDSGEAREFWLRATGLALGDTAMRGEL